ncbi:putative membrane protein [Leeuwenhoekiella aestuarii]|uniref:Putative membrane protein n=1 Tax=Leeuwenhoekiella aestuarii TaxID=2249426 RepID=A0A4Q0P025_9FLAO|nr:PH domain-containing protein [Leeuwenhoekiella aestuarii]RXG16259.1 putative membrane protein [Leeuwenhoekiella aestuarii]RXG16952.1 putative membrane protein [Leeuwenhoekiella aestuarii]
MNRSFSEPQLQSKPGVLFIFFSQFYKFLRALGPVLLYFIIKGPKTDYTALIIFGIAAALLLLLGFSVLSFYRFKFHIDYKNSEFVLQKGVFSTELISIPFSKIQQVYFKRSLLQRVIGVYSVVIDTAGSSGQEINIKALSESKAKDLQQVLMNAVNETNQETEAANSDKPKEEKKISSTVWNYRLSPLSLLKLGLTSNYFRGVWLILIFVGSIYQQVGDFDLVQSDQYKEGLKGYLDAYSKPIELFILTALVFIGVFIIGMIISCIEIFIKYFDLNLTQTKESLELEMGLKTNTKISLKPKRVQLLRVVTNPIQKRLNLQETQIALASSQDNLSKTKICIPGLERMQIERVKRFLFSSPMRPGRVFKPAFILYIRLLILASLPLILTAVVASFLVPNYMVEIMSILFIIFGMLIIPYQYYWYRALSLEITPEFIIRRKGVWNQKTEIIELFKLQAVTVDQPIWYKKRQLYNYTFHTAGGAISFPLTSHKMQQYINYALYRVEINKQAWM